MGTFSRGYLRILPPNGLLAQCPNRAFVRNQGPYYSENGVQRTTSSRSTSAPRFGFVECFARRFRCVVAGMVSAVHTSARACTYQLR